MRYRDKHLPPPEEAAAEAPPEAGGADTAPAEEPPPAPPAEPGEALEGEDVEEQMWAELEVLVDQVNADWTARPAPLPAPLPARPAPAAALLDLPEPQNRRLQALLGRQARLPMEVAEPPGPLRRGPLEPAESREELIERLLDPILSINEAAVLCGVCPASIRRYTNRGVLKCFRTPGNQRRFRLSDVLDFMERQQQEPLD
jgi:excisionase family DNA binding protein